MPNHRKERGDADRRGQDREGRGRYAPRQRREHQETIVGAVLVSDLVAKKNNLAADLAKRLKNSSKEERKELMSLVTSEMAKARWHRLTREQRIETMRQVAAGGADAKPKPRCPCGAMTLKRGLARRHVILDGQGHPAGCKSV